MDELIAKYEKELKHADRIRDVAWDKSDSLKSWFYTGRMELLNDIIQDLKELREVSPPSPKTLKDKVKNAIDEAFKE